MLLAELVEPYGEQGAVVAYDVLMGWENASSEPRPFWVVQLLFEKGSILSGLAARMMLWRRRKREVPFWNRDRRRTVDMLIKRCDALVWRIDTGHEGSYVGDFWAELTVRDVVDRLIASLPRGPLLEAMSARVAGIDNQFRDAPKGMLEA